VHINDNESSDSIAVTIFAGEKYTAYRKHRLIHKDPFIVIAAIKVLLHKRNRLICQVIYSVTKK